jgi:4,5-DOPA dioxygenase extradiol
MDSERARYDAFMRSILDPDTPAGAYKEFLVTAAPASREHRRWTPSDGPLPALYLSHGAPPLFDDALWLTEFFAWSRDLPKPRAVVIVSAHWESAPAALSAPAAGTPLVYDFGGFHPRYYEMTYRTPDASELASRIIAAMPASEPVHQHPRRGLDHGAWVPLMAMYPNADVPVLQLSLPSHDPLRLLELGRYLAPLREEGVLLIGSGFMTHGLPFITPQMLAGKVPAWSAEFDAWVADALDRGDVGELADYQKRAPGLPYAHPTTEHYVPLFVAFGAASAPQRPARTTISGFMMGLSKRSFEVY